MSVVRMQKPDGRPESGGGMDRVVERKGLPNQVKITLFPYTTLFRSRKSVV